MVRRIVAHHVLALCAALAGLSAPATAVLHGLEHEHESAALASHMPAQGERDTHTAGLAVAAVEATDADETHTALHARYAAQKPTQFATDMSASRSHDFATPQCESNARIRWFAIAVHASPPGDRAAQPRAPPLA